MKLNRPLPSFLAGILMLGQAYVAMRPTATLCRKGFSRCPFLDLAVSKTGLFHHDAAQRFAPKRRVTSSSRLRP